MTEQLAKRILGDAIVPDGLIWFGPDDRLVDWTHTDSTVHLSGRYYPLELEAIAWWVGHKQRQG